MASHALFCSSNSLAQSQGFTQNTEVILLTTNLLQKELRGAVGGGMQGVYEAGLAINCLSNIVTEDLAKDLLPELTNLTSHPQPYLRKKAILCLFKLFVKYPQGLRLSFARLQQCLEDPNSSVISCAVNVITELSDKNPKNYLHLAPSFFLLLTQSSNNWMLIKVVKLLGSLVPEEPRLARKLLDPLAGIVRTTQAKSLLYESVRTITLCLPYCRKSDGSMPQNVPEIVDLCANTLLDFVTQMDQNLKYLGLVGFGSLMQSYPRVLSDPKYRPLILACLSDQDVTIRTRALDLLTGMTTRKNLMELVSQLLTHVEMASGTYKLDLVAKIIEMCSSEKYTLLQDFAWYLDVLFQIGHMRGIDPHGELLRAQVTDVALRVLPVRPYAVRRSMEILLEREQQFLAGTDNDLYGDNGRGKHMMHEILPAIAWIIGEYSDLIRRALSIDPAEKGEKTFTYDQDSTGTYHAIIQSLSAPANTQKLPTTTQKVYLQAAVKVFAAAASDKDVHSKELESCVQTIHRNYPVYMQSLDVEVVERSFTLMELLQSLGLSPSLTPGLMASEESTDEEGDLLDMAGEPEGKPKQVLDSSVTEKSLAEKVRDCSDTLVALLKPSPMKPSGLKAQRKKRLTPIGVTLDVDAPVNLAIFSALIEEEQALRSSSRMSMDSVSFTQQKPFQAEAKPGVSTGGQGVPPVLGSAAFTSEMPASFQHPAGSGDVSSRHRAGDPFLLPSAPARVDTDSAFEDSLPVPNRFGTIQLSVGSDDEADAEDNAKQQKKKHKKSKKVTSKRSAADAWVGIGGTEGFPVYSSDDDDDNDHQHRHHGSKSKGKRGQGREFSGLAKVDLTEPLREDEVMPQRTHRVVPDRPLQHASELKNEKKKKAKKDKKSKKDARDTVGDLLDLGAAFGAVAASAPASTLSAPAHLPGLSSFDPIASKPAGNPIDSAFDFLGLAAPAPAPLPGYDFEPAPLLSGEDSSPKKKGKRPWLKATVKLSKEQSSVDWSQVFVVVRAYSVNKGSAIGAKVVIRVDNRTNFPLSDLSVTFKKYDSVGIGTVAPMSSVESKKIGPFPYSDVDTTEEIKGSLECGGASATVKIYLPASLHLQPDHGVSLNQVQQELMAPGWASSSASVNLESAKDPAYIQSALSAFLQASLVVDSAGVSDPTTALFAARARQGLPVRFLLKVKPANRSFQVDVKSTNAALAKSLAADIKRLVLM